MCTCTESSGCITTIAHQKSTWTVFPAPSLQMPHALDNNSQEYVDHRSDIVNVEEKNQSRTGYSQCARD
jgi:hypothetical protein